MSLLSRKLSGVDLLFQKLLVLLIGVLVLIVQLIFKLIDGLLSLDGLFLAVFLNFGNMLSEFLAFTLSSGSSLFSSGG